MTDTGTDDEAPDARSSGEAQVDFYWRPGCPFCMMLVRGLHKSGIPIREINIWDDPLAAAFVRTHANGNETVPTVDVAGTVMVNPPVKAVLAAAEEAGIDFERPPARWRRNP